MSYTIQDFKDLFFRDFPYLPIWAVVNQPYNTDDEVYYEVTKLFYKALKDGVVSVPTDTNDWVKITDDINNYVLDADIEKAFQEANASFNESLYTSEEYKKQAYLYLTAHYLVLDLRNSQTGIQSTGVFSVNSRSVGSVSESYTIPERFIKNPILAYYTSSGYGLKYLNLTYPRIVGNVVAVSGKSTP